LEGSVVDDELYTFLGRSGWEGKGRMIRRNRTLSFGWMESGRRNDHIRFSFPSFPSWKEVETKDCDRVVEMKVFMFYYIWGDHVSPKYMGRR
jgi:hypothetical protein